MCLGNQKKKLSSLKTVLLFSRSGSGFLENSGLKIAARWRQYRDGRLRRSSILCGTVSLRCRCNVTVGDCKNSTMWNGGGDEVLINFVRNNDVGTTHLKSRGWI